MMCWRAGRSISAIWCRWMKHKQRKTHPQAKRSLRGVPFDFVACTSWMSRRKSIQLSWMKSCSSTSSCRVRQKQTTSKRYAPMPLRQPLHGCSRHMGSSTMHSWHGKASRILLHGSANRRSLYPFGSFSIVLKRRCILPLTITKIHLNGKRITRHEADFSASWRAFSVLFVTLTDSGNSAARCTNDYSAASCFTGSERSPSAHNADARPIPG